MLITNVNQHPFDGHRADIRLQSLSFAGCRNADSRCSPTIVATHTPINIRTQVDFMHVCTGLFTRVLIFNTSVAILGYRLMASHRRQVVSLVAKKNIIRIVLTLHFSTSKVSKCIRRFKSVCFRSTGSLAAGGNGAGLLVDYDLCVIVFGSFVYVCPSALEWMLIFCDASVQFY